MWLLTSKYVSDDYLYYFMARYSWGKFESSDWLQLGQDFALNSRAIDFLVTLHLMKVSVHGQPVRTISYLINNQSYLSGGLKLAAKTNQFCAQTPWGDYNNNLFYTYTGKPQTPPPAQYSNPFQLASACTSIYI